MNNKEKIEAKIREAIGKPEGELTKADYDKVTSLDLRWNKGIRLGLTKVQGLGKLTQLTSLVLGGNKLTKVQGLGKLRQLTWLSLVNNKLTDVKGLEKLTQLKQLYLGGNQLTAVPKGLENLTQLEELHLEVNQLTDVPKGLEKLTHLTKLFLSNNQLTKLPESLEKLTQLERLYLKNNQLTEIPKGLEKLTQLTVLELSNNKLTNVKGLEKLTQLEELNLKYNQISKADIKALKAALPNCMIKEGAEVHFKGTFRVLIPSNLHPITGMEIREEHIFTTPELEFTYILTNFELARGGAGMLMSDPNFDDALKPLMQKCCDHIAQTADMSEQVALWVDCGLDNAGCTLNGEEASGFWYTYSKGDKLMEEWDPSF